MDNPGNDTPDDRNRRSLPSLLIPYWEPGTLYAGDPGDRGDVRPPPGGIVSYLCPGITTAAPYQPGQPLTVTVAVRNWGGGVVGSIATVRVWWEFPGTSFVAMNPNRLIGVDSVEIPPRGATAYSSPMTHVFATLPPPHICLVACVDHVNDPAPRRVDPPHALIPMPGTERHWAQHNLSYVAPGPDGSIDFFFTAGNPFQQEAEFVFEVRPFARDRLDRLVHTLRTDVVTAEARCEIRAARDLRNNGHAAGQARHPYALVLDGGRQTAMHLRMQLGDAPRAGPPAVLELVQRRADEDRPLGGILLVVGTPAPLDKIRS